MEVVYRTNSTPILDKQLVMIRIKILPNPRADSSLKPRLLQSTEAVCHFGLSYFVAFRERGVSRVLPGDAIRQANGCCMSTTKNMLEYAIRMECFCAGSRWPCNASESR
jgi:hypothetical protein